MGNNSTRYKHEVGVKSMPRGEVPIDVIREISKIYLDKECLEKSHSIYTKCNCELVEITCSCGKKTFYCDICKQRRKITEDLHYKGHLSS